MKALLWTEWVLVLRDRRATAAGVAMVLLLSLVPHLFSRVFDAPPDFQEELGIEAPVVVSGELGWVVEGPRPAWLDPGLGTAAAPEALVRFWTETGAESGVHFEVLGLVPGARLDAVARVVKEAAFEERQQRAAQVGMVGPWEETLQVVFLDTPVPSAPFRFPDVPLGAVVVLIAGTMGSLSWIMESLPRARAGGWLESLAALPLRRGQVVSAWLGVACTMTLVGVAIGYLGHLLGGRLSGETGLGPRGWLVPCGALLLVPLQVLAFATAHDLRASVMRSLWVLPGLSVLILGALVCLSAAPGWVPWIPVGGLVVACLGLVGPSSLPLTLGVSVAVSLAAVWASVLVLEGPGAQVQAVGRVAARRARGNWFPEAALLVALGIASSVAWSPGIWQEDLVRVLLTSHLLFYALPALVAPRVLGVPSRDLLHLVWPGARTLALAGFGAAATLAFGVLAHALQQAWVPMDPVWAKLAEDAVLPLSLPASLLLLAVLPGVCEELLFRGAVLGLLRKGLPAGVAVVVQAALFALAHVYGFKWAPTFGVGLATGWLVVRTGSLLPAMVLHVLHNGVAVWFSGRIVLDLTSLEFQAVLVGALVFGGAALARAGRGSGGREPTPGGKDAG